MSKKEEYSIEDEIRDAMAGKIDVVDREGEDPEEPIEEPEENQGEDEPKDNDGEKKEGEEDKTKETPKEPEVEDTPPVSLSGAIKEKWKDLPADVRAEWKKREDDIHRQMTAQDGDLAVGRRIKEIAQPYEATIRAEGGSVEGAFKDLMNTAYVLRTGSPQQKAQVIMDAVQNFNIDLSPYMGQQQGQNNTTALQKEIEYLRQNQVDPAQIKTQLQEEMERDRIQSEIRAFAANPDNKHFEEVKSIMGSLISSGKAKDLQEAYDSAIWSVPSIRAELEAEAEKAKAEKRKAEMAQKKKAAASVAGSPGVASPSKNAPQRSLEDELREQMQASQGKI